MVGITLPIYGPNWIYRVFFRSMLDSGDLLFRNYWPWMPDCCRNERLCAIPLFLWSSEIARRIHCARTLWRTNCRVILDTVWRDRLTSYVSLLRLLICSPASHVRRAPCTLTYLPSRICHSALGDWLSLTQFEILHTVLPLRYWLITLFRKTSTNRRWILSHEELSVLDNCFSGPSIFNWQILLRLCSRLLSSGVALLSDEHGKFRNHAP